MERIDTRGLKCPWPVLRAARAMRETDEIMLLADDPVALIDLPVLAQANDWALDVRELADHAEFHIARAGIFPRVKAPFTEKPDTLQQ